MTEHDPFDSLEQELRERVAGEFRRTAEEDEYAARKAALRRRSLPDIAYELLSRGDTVVATCGDVSYRGVLTHAHGSLATLATANGDVHLNLAGPITLHVAERSPTGGRTRNKLGPESFVARLRQLELEEVAVELVIPATRDTPTGRIEAVAADHVMLRDTADTDWYLPLNVIAAVIAR